MNIICSKKTPTLDAVGKAEGKRYIAQGDNCAVTQFITQGQLIEIAYPVPDGTRRGYVKSLKNFNTGVVVYNQRDYSSTKYPAKGYEQATVATSGCGPTCMSMIVETLTGKSFVPPVSADFSIKSGARVSGGTNVVRLAGLVASKFGLKHRASNDMAELKAVLGRGGMAIVNVAGDRVGRKGVFSNGGHFIVAAGVAGDDIMIADPLMYDGKFSSPHRVAVRQDGKVLYCSDNTVAEDSAGRNPRYYLFEK